MGRSCSLFEERCHISVRGHCGSCAPGGAGITRIVSVRLLRWCPGHCSVGLLCLFGLFCAGVIDFGLAEVELSEVEWVEVEHPLLVLLSRVRLAGTIESPCLVVFPHWR